MNPRLRIALDFAPLAVFGITYAFYGLLTATGAIMASVLVAVAIELIVQRRVSPMLGFTCVLVMVLGGLTLWMSNGVFIKIKPTILYTMFAGILLGGLAQGRLFIKALMGQALRLPDVAWRTLTWRFAWFFLALAVLNEIIWRNASDNLWVMFKVFGIFPLTLLFIASQTPFIMRHQIVSDEAPPAT